MPRYYFDMIYPNVQRRDEEGSDLATFNVARVECQGLLSDMVRDQPLNSELHTVTCDVRDEMDRIVYRGELTYRGTMSPTPGARTS